MLDEGYLLILCLIICVVGIILWYMMLQNDYNEFFNKSLKDIQKSLEQLKESIKQLKDKLNNN